MAKKAELIVDGKKLAGVKPGQGVIPESRDSPRRR